MTSPSGKKFTLCFLLTFAAAWLFVVAVHWLGNPDEIFASPLVGNHGNRAFKSRRLEDAIRSGNAPQIVILGSSRLMQYSPAQIEAITGKRAFNYADVGASAIEFQAQLNYLRRLKPKPELLIIGIDERSLFGLYHQWEGRMVEDWHLLRELPRDRQAAIIWQAITQIQFEHTPQAIINLFHKPTFVPKPMISGGNALLADGYRIRTHESISLLRHSFDVESRRASVQKNVAAAIQRSSSQFDGTTIQPEQVKRVNDLLVSARKAGFKVKLVFTPMQPLYASRVLSPSASRELDAYAARVRTQCRKLGFEFYDFRNLQSFGGIDYEFWDEQHPTPANTARMVNVLFGCKPDTPHPDVPSDSELISHEPAVHSQNTW